MVGRKTCGDGQAGPEKGPSPTDVAYFFFLKQLLEGRAKLDPALMLRRSAR